MTVVGDLSCMIWADGNGFRQMAVMLAAGRDEKAYRHAQTEDGTRMG
jgi:hypothetical protein